MPLDQIDVDNDLPAAQTGEKEMSFLDHLEELRWHLVRGVSAIGVLAVIAFASGQWVFDTIIMAPLDKGFISYRIINSAIPGLEFYPPPDLELIAVMFGEQFIVHLKTSFVLGVVLSFPYLFWEIWRFIKPGLYPQERKAARGIVGICSFLFIAGVAFGYFIIAPFAVTFLGSYSVGAVNAPTLSSFVNYMTMFTVPVGVIFELPIVVYFLAKVGLLYPQTMKSYRRHAFIIILILAAIITPPDVVTQFLIGIPLYVLYEISIRICSRVVKRAEAKRQ
ncbi:MAG: twin-arginine translocase subunit TatC [Bacteroidota bacterium]